MEREPKLELEAGDRLPEWIRLLPRGRVELVDGRPPFEVDQESLGAMVQAFEARGVDLVVDYEHQSLNGGRAPAAGWIKELEARDDGLWARIEWTAQAQEYLRQKEYRYFSPVLKLDPETRKPLALLQVALTNVPAMKGVSPLVAKYGGGASDQAVQVADRSIQEADPGMEELKSRLGLDSGARPEALWQLADEFFRELAGTLGLEKGATAVQVKARVEALKAETAQAEALREELENLKIQLAEEQRNRMVEEALKAGKISPAQKNWALEYCRQDPKGFRAFATQAPKVVPVGVTLDRGPQSSAAEARLSSKEMAVCRAANIGPELYLQAKEAKNQDNDTEV